MSGAGLEIERKYLIIMPPAAFLAAGEVWEITQTYLKAEEGNRRVREIRTAAGTTYVYTAKQRINALTCREEEREIDRETYLAYLDEARPDSAPVCKTRYRVPHAGHLLEIDVYPFWKDTAVLEVELTNEEDIPLLPEQIRILREVTGEALYKNTNIARFLREHPGEPLPL